ncbi:SHOCT domain-containing protein [Halovivax gelatinilyticus]|uniref:SHOCT domain-containing protein n=1 Tax=Halovivax gelatinilyticus TaxID=2961597 RepID=UPI0020CA8E92|nr:SHOCT domain-containing protein [Halovivax gelatinilyticus]
MSDRLREFVAEDLWLFVAIVTFALAGLAALAGLGVGSAVIATIGWFLLTPILLFWGEEIAAALFDEAESSAADSTPDAYEELKNRYATGEIDEAEFERRLDRLVTVDDALEGAFSGDRERTAADADGRATDDPPIDAASDGSLDEPASTERERAFE